MLDRSLPLRLVLLFWACTCSAMDPHQCVPSFCGNNIIKNPFRLKTDPKICGHPEYELGCEDDRAVLYLDEGKYYVQSINYDNFTIRIVDAGLQVGNCSSMPYSSFQCYKYKSNSTYSCSRSYINKTTSRIGFYHVNDEIISRTVAYVECANEIRSPFYTKTSPCIKSQNSSSSFSRTNGHSYVVDVHNASCLEGSCSILLVSRTSWPASRSYQQLSYEHIHEEIVYGFELSWLRFLCKRCRYYQHCQLIHENQKHRSECSISFSLFGTCNADAVARVYIVTWFLLTRGVGPLCVAIFLIYKWRRRHRAMDENIEEFLQSQKKLFPIRYSYSNIKKIARNFKNKLGEGGYGSVYKGKLRSGQDVAIKILKNAKSNGQDFINEVATIGRIHHVNVVQLIGFCVEGSKCALIYDFMPNGSLDKYIFYQENGKSLGCNEMYEISLAVARGIEYLHGGCGMQILHFDIKPHNILLDKNFIPKISDFGLAKLYPTSYNVVSLTTARGTLGYMAPELFYNTIGGVSYKADIYSFGKLLMEMVRRRQNINAITEHSSQIYFPSWVYDQVTKGNNNEIIDVMEEEERKIMEKMMIVALWCTQMNPDDRPSMHGVLKMLEGHENLPMPCKPLLYSPEMPVEVPDIDTNF